MLILIAVLLFAILLFVMPPRAAKVLFISALTVAACFVVAFLAMFYHRSGGQW